MAEPQWAYGRHPVTEFLRAQSHAIQKLFISSAGGSTRLSDLISLAKKQGVTVMTVSRRQIEDMVGPVNHQGVVAQLKPFVYKSVDEILGVADRRGEAPLILVLDQIQDPHNLGSIARSGLALGAHGIIIPKDRACEVTPTVSRSSAGATAKIAIARVTNIRNSLDELRQAGIWVFGTVAEAGGPLHEQDFTGAVALVIGSEGKGIRPLVQRSCDALVEIPTSGKIGSLNASVAAGIALYEATRQRLG